MVDILRDFPAIHQTLNIVPCLSEQLTAYLKVGAKDRALEVSLIHAETSRTTSDLSSVSFSVLMWIVLSDYIQGIGSYCS